MPESYTIPHAFKKSALSHPEKIALRAKAGDTYKTYTYGELFNRAENLATFLVSEGIEKGDRIAICAETCPEWGIAYLGIVTAGAIAVPIDMELEAEGIRNILKHSRSKVIFISEENREKIIGAFEGLDNIRIINLASIKGLSQNTRSSDDFSNSLNRAEVGNGRQGIYEDDIASIVYTSGTTGTPKGVMLSHKNLCFDAFGIIKAGLVSKDEHILGVLPLHHTYPFMATLITPLFVGATVTYLTELKWPEIAKTMKECGITIFIAVPQILDMLLRGIHSKIENPVLKGLIRVCGFLRRSAGLNPGKIIFSKVHKNLAPHLRFFVSGGAKLDPDTAKGLFALGFTVLEGYGLTETSPVAAFNPEKTPRIGSVGLPISGVEITILNPDVNGIGEIAVKGPIVMQGYYLNPEETAKIVQNGLLMTGDSGYKDKDGYIYITGRLKEVIVLSSGKNIYPEEIEKHYLSLPLIKELCIIGIENKTGITEHLQAVIVPNLDYAKEKNIANLNEAVKWEINALSSKLPSYKRIMGYTISAEPLPRTRLGKIRRFMVKELLQEKKRLPQAEMKKEMSVDDAVIMQNHSVRKMIAHLKAVAKKEVINLDDNLELDLGIDSLQRVELAVIMEEIAGAKIPEGLGADIISVRELVNKLMEFKGSSITKSKANRWPRVFEEEPDEEGKISIGLNQGIVERMIVCSGLVFLKAISKLFFRLEAEGLENLPRPPYIIAANHTSFVDGFALASAAPLQVFYNLYFVAIHEYFKNPIAKIFARLSHIIPINPDAYLYNSMQLSGYVLKKGKALCIFPEGGRSIDGRLMTFKKGVGILARELDAPLIPTIIDGAFAALPVGAWLPRPAKIRVIFGRPVYPKDIDFSKKPAGMDDYEWTASCLKNEMAAMLDKVNNGCFS